MFSTDSVARKPVITKNIGHANESSPAIATGGVNGYDSKNRQSAQSIDHP